jgi:hypothetical protein
MLSMRCFLVPLGCRLLVGWCWGGDRIDVIYSTGSTPLQVLWRRPETTNARSLGSEGREWLAILEERAGCRDRWQASDEQGRGGRSFRVMNGHSSAFGIFFLQFGVPGFRINFFDIICIFSQVSITLGGVVVALWSSGGVRAVAGVHKSYAMHKSTTVHVSSVGSLQQDRRKKTHKSIIQLYSM